jgi:UDP-N-acetylglucosamine 4,6-dehydratase
MFKGSVLMITGGTGSFGNTVLKRFLESDIKEIIVFSRDEKKQEDMRIAFKNDKLRFHLGDTRDYNSIKTAMSGVDYVFHAAALKQVPSCEFFPLEAVKTNILGTENVLNAAIESNVKKVVLLSTDKAVYPINSMGLSKALAEKVLIAKSKSIGKNGPIFCATRYGNVMASRGSVIPLFVEQIKSNKSITITDPNMTRFLMSLQESVDLVLHAFANAEQGDIFVQKAPASTIGDLYLAIKLLFKNYTANPSVNIIGTRHGEKLYETLLSREERVRAEDMGKYFRIKADDRNLNYNQSNNKFILDGEPKITEIEDYTSHNTLRLNVEEVVDILLKLDFIKNERKELGFLN